MDKSARRKAQPAAAHHPDPLRRITALQRHSTSSIPTRRAVSTSSLTRIPTAGDSSRMWGSPFVPDIGTVAEVAHRRGAVVLGNLAGCPRCRQAPATTTTVVPRAVPAAAGARVVGDDLVHLVRPGIRLEVRPARLEVHLVRPEVHLVRPEVRLEARPEARLEARLEVRPEVRPGRYPRAVRSVQVESSHVTGLWRERCSSSPQTMPPSRSALAAPADSRSRCQLALTESPVARPRSWKCSPRARRGNRHAPPSSTSPSWQAGRYRSPSRAPYRRPGRPGVGPTGSVRRGQADGMR